MPAFAEVHNGVVVNHYYFASKPTIDESRVKLVEVPKDNIPPIGAEYKDGHFFSEKMITLTDKIDIIRTERNRRLNEVAWAVDRHRQERELKELGRIKRTTLSEKQYKELLIYIQDLRELTQTWNLDQAFTSLNDLSWPWISVNIINKIVCSYAGNTFVGTYVK